MKKTKKPLRKGHLYLIKSFVFDYRYSYSRSWYDNDFYRCGSLRRGSASAGAVIFIGPFPIIIGVGPDAPLIVLFSIIIAILSIAVFLVINKN